MDGKDEIHYLTVKQTKLVSNSTRIKILHLLKDAPYTAKQAADLLNKSPGSIHYHIKLLHEGGLLRLVKTQMNGGVQEKYYQSNTTVFQSSEDLPIVGRQIGYMGTRLSLSEDGLKQFREELRSLLEKWESDMNTSVVGEMEISVSCLLHEVNDEEA